MGSAIVMENDNEKLVSIELTKEQWEEVYQWFLVTKDIYRIEDYEKEAGEKIKETLIREFGTFR